MHSKPIRWDWIIFLAVILLLDFISGWGNGWVILVVIPGAYLLGRWDSEFGKRWREGSKD